MMMKFAKFLGQFMLAGFQESACGQAKAVLRFSGDDLAKKDFRTEIVLRSCLFGKRSHRASAVEVPIQDQALSLHSRSRG